MDWDAKTHTTTKAFTDEFMMRVWGINHAVIARWQYKNCPLCRARVSRMHQQYHRRKRKK